MSFVQDLEATIVESDIRLGFPCCWRLGVGCKRLSHLSLSSLPFVRRGLSPLDNFEFRPGRKCCPALFFSEPIHLEAELLRNLSLNLRQRLGKEQSCGCLRLAIRTQRNENIRSEEHTSELQSLMRISYAVFCLRKKTNKR